MEEAEVPLENLQEHVHHSAEHSGEAWVSWVALSTAILAVLATIASLLSGQHANEAMMSQIAASDQWNYYQSKSIKASVLDTKISLASDAAKPVAAHGGCQFSHHIAQHIYLVVRYVVNVFTWQRVVHAQ